MKWICVWTQEFLSSINESADGIQCILEDIFGTNPGLVNHEDPTDVASTKKEKEVIEEAVQNDNKDQLINTDTTTICLCLTRTIKHSKKDEQKKPETLQPAIRRTYI